MEIISLPTEFDWDEYNIEHVRIHRVELGECEQIFFNILLTLEIDLIHSRDEKRYFALGKTNTNRILVVIFTLRKTKMRVITARDANKKERIRYET